ncbi:MAG: YihA family ribosome biogenesis GTP-binding protein [Clostridia bacterium]|nr:YihA family ribosome biogenesis GTP-binding protein [Clostridia bacterium]
MIIKKSRFARSLSAFTSFPGQGLPEIAMVGKSNVGKSSLINSLTGNGKLARISSEPGKTRLINLYLINERFFLVDLPGYGFAKAPKQEKQRWADMIEGYLRTSDNLKRVFQLVDIRHAPTEDDQLMVEYLRHYDIPFTVVATKADKLSKAQRGRSIPLICRTLGAQPWEVLVHSSRDGTGKEKLLEQVEAEVTDVGEQVDCRPQPAHLDQ